MKAVRAARAAARERAWALAGDAVPGAGGLVTVDLHSTVVIAHSDEEQAAPTWKKTFGFHPMAAWADHGQDGNGEPLAIVLLPGTRARTPPPTTSRPPGWPWPSCPAGPGAGS